MSTGLFQTLTALSRYLRAPFQRVFAAALFCLLSFWTVPMACSQDLDEARKNNLSHPKVLAWENLGPTRQFLCGIKPKRSLRLKKSLVTLCPNESIDFLVPAYSLVRVELCDANANDRPVEIWCSNGSGLLRKHLSAISSDGCSIIAAPNQSKLSVAKVWRPDHCNGPVTVAIYTSRQPELKTLDYYECSILNGDGKCEISNDRGSEIRSYCRFESANRKRLSVDGPNRLRFEARLRYGEDEEVRQTFWIYVFVDRALERVLPFDTIPESNQRMFVDGCERVIGQREYGYIDLECHGKNVEIESSHPLYLRVDGIGLDLCRPNRNHQFSLPSNGSSEHHVSYWDAPPFDPSTAQMDLSFLDETLVAQPTHDLNRDPYANQQRIRSLARNNRFPHGGLRAYMWMRAIAASHQGGITFGRELSVSGLASNIRRHYTFFRDLPPSSVGFEHRSVWLGFIERDIRQPDEQKTERTIGEQHVPDNVRRMSKSRLTTLGPENGYRLVYETPKDVGATMLRVLADQSHLSSGSRLMVRFDDRPAMELVVQANEGVADPCQTRTQTDAALAGLTALHPKYDSGTVGGPFAMHAQPLPLVRMATGEIFKPADVNRIEIWKPEDDGQTLNLGLQYLDARKVELSESAYLHLLDLESKLAANTQDPNLARFVRQELENNSVGLESLLQSHLLDFSSSVQASSLTETPTDLYDSFVIATKKNEAERFGEMNQWPTVIEILSELVNHTNGEVRRQAILDRTDALEMAGEFFLADRERRGWLLYSDDPQLKLAMLEQLLKSTDNELVKEMFATVAAVHNRSPEFELRLAEQMVKNGRFREAVLLIGERPIDASNFELILQCAYQLRWWKMYERVLRHIDIPEIKNLWKAKRLAYQGRYKQAGQLFQAAGEAGFQWLEYWKQGDQLFKQLQTGSPEKRLRAIAPWETWQTSNPSRRMWRSMQVAIQSSAGQRVIVSPRRNVRSPMFLATPTQPIVLEVNGPGRIRLESRPIHKDGNEDAIDDWIRINSAGQTEFFPILSNRASQSLKLDGQSNALPGQIVANEIELSPGLNRIELNAEKTDLLVRLQEFVPEFRLPVLPPINNVTLAAIVKGNFGTRSEQCCEGKHCLDCTRLVCLDQKCESCQLSFHCRPCGCGELHGALSYFEKLPFSAARGWEDRFVPAGTPVTVMEIDEPMRQAIQFARSVDNKSYYYELSDRIKQIADLETLLKEHPNNRHLRRLATRMKSGSSWENFLQFNARAGIHSKEPEGWQPETPSLRIRKSLISESLVSKDFISGNSSLVFDVSDDQPTRFDVQLQRPQISFVPLSPTIAIVRSANRSDSVTLEPNENPATIKTSLASGSQQFEVLHGNPLANHFLATEVREVLEDDQATPLFQQLIRPKRAARTYQVATHDEPIQFSVAAPNLLRIDKQENGRTISELIPILEDQSFELRPDEGEKGLYRIFELKMDSTPLASYRPKTEPTPPTEDWANTIVQTLYEEIDGSANNELELMGLRSPDLEPVEAIVRDQGIQQHFGTLGLETGFVRRLAFEEFPTGRVPEQFFNVQVSRYHYDQWRDRYTNTNLVFRPRIDSGPTYGITHRVARQLPLAKCKPGAKADGWGDYNASWKGYFYTQYAGTPLVSNANSNPWTLGFSGIVSRWHRINERIRHRPAVNFFARALSEEVNGFPGGELDQDIFTQYKSDHPYGIRLTDRFICQNCLDRRWWLRPQLVSNADQLVPDNLGFQVGTDQLLGPLQLRASYRLTNYFADNDRRESVVQNVFYLDCVFERWHNGRRRSEIQFSLRNDLGDGSTSLGFNLASFLNQYRGYRDFDPGTMRFLPIREERFASEIVNE